MYLAAIEKNMAGQKQTKEIRKKANRKRISRHSDIVGNKFYIKFFAESHFLLYSYDVSYFNFNWFDFL